MPKLGERRTIEGREQMYTPAQGGWIDVKQPPETGKLDETEAPEIEGTAEELIKAGGEIREAPEKRIDNTDLMSKTAGMEDLLQMYAQRSQQVLEQQQEAQKTFLEKLKSTFKPSEREREVLEEAGVPEQMTQLQESIATAKGIRENIINLEAQRDAALAATEQRPVSMATITREQAKIEEDFNRRIATASKRLAAESAYQQALQGNISLARSMAQEEVKYATWEEDRRLDILETTYEMNQDIIKSMGAEYDKIFQLAIDEAKDRRDKTEKEKQDIMNLQLSAATDYGIKLDLMDKTLEEAQKEYNEAVALLAAEEREIELARKRQLAAGETEVGETIEDLTQGQRDTLAGLLAQVPNYSSKEEALEDLAKRRTQITIQVGEVGYNTLVEEIQNTLPSKGVPKAPKETTPAWRKEFQIETPEFLKKAYQSVGSFFKRLF